MNNHFPNWKSLLYTGGPFIFELAYKILEIKFFKGTRKQTDTSVNEILLYGAKGEETTKKIGLDNLLCIYYVLLHASRSIDVCVPSLSSEALANCFISARQKNKLKIRITIHSSDDFVCLPLLAQNGIEVKIINPAVRLEHEFALVDASGGFDDAVAVMGSLVYDPTQVNCRRDATILTSETTVVRSLKKEFERVWNSVVDIQDKNGKYTIKIN